MITEKKKIILTDEKFKEIYTSEKFRNEVAFAHKCCDANGNLKHFQTCSYPVTYIVTEDQINAAKIERKKAISKYAKENTYKLLFIGMGMEYKKRYQDDVCNHRVRTEFLNPDGRRFFIEFGTGRNKGELRVDHSVDRDLELEMNKKAGEYRKKAIKAREDHNYRKETYYYELMREQLKQPYYNYKGLEKNNYLGEYTKSNLLKIVNENFGCNFKEIVIDNYNLSCDGVICESPKK